MTDDIKDGSVSSQVSGGVVVNVIWHTCARESKTFATPDSLLV